MEKSWDFMARTCHRQGNDMEEDAFDNYLSEINKVYLMVDVTK